MREIRTMTNKEIANYRENVRRIEEFMDHPIPPGLLDMEDLGRPLSAKEIASIREDIRRIEEVSPRNRKSNHSYIHYNSDNSSAIAGISFLGGCLFLASFIESEYSMIPVALILMIPAISKIVRYFRR